MARLDRYILSRLAGPFAVSALVLIGIYWVGRAVSLFDEIIGDGQPVSRFMTFILLFLPQVVAIVLPVVSFVAALVASQSLHSDSEMVVLQSAGISPFRLLRPYVIFGLLVAILASALSHYLVPASFVKLREHRQAMAQDIATRLIVGGKFLHPSENTTFFVREIRPDGSLIDIFLHDQRDDDRDVTYTASRALLVKNGQQARLIMFDGLIQTFDRKLQLLSKIQFDEFVIDPGALTTAQEQNKPIISQYSTWQTLFPTPEMIAESGISRDEFLFEANKRIEQPLQSLIYPLIGMAAFMLGGFSRFGQLKQGFAAVALVLVIAASAITLRGDVQRDPSLWALLYLPDLAGILMVFLMLGPMQNLRFRRLMRLPVGAAT